MPAANVLIRALAGDGILVTVFQGIVVIVARPQHLVDFLVQLPVLDGQIIVHTRSGIRMVEYMEVRPLL